MVVPARLGELVDHFRENKADYKSAAYNETRLRREFIDPFFELLGWDIQNNNRYAEAYKDVIHEDSIRIGSNVKAPDYAFRIGGTRKFFLEAKKPSVNIRSDPHPAYQLRRYAWSAKLPLSVLTDFEELALYDCRIAPSKGDRSSVARVMYLTFDQYEEKWEEIAGILGREAILRGAFDRYAEDNKRKRGTSEVDDAFLAEIEIWRASLASNITLRNRSVDARQLNTSVQQIIDRIIFLRIAEDRGIEPYGTLGKLAIGKDAYLRLGQIFRLADKRYNSGLFHFKPSPDVSEPVDAVSLGLTIDDQVIRSIVKGLYYPDSPYEFSVLPADILGQVYEQFLGKVIEIRGRKALVERKPEVKKAGGVYYTPTYIVRHLVASTLNPLLEGRTATQVAGLDRRSKTSAPLRVVDPACGSGSFLIEVYQHLLDWYLATYISEGAAKYSKGREPKIYQTGAGEWRLSIAERRRILLDHIYGVDLDRQAVEVTKLSLCLKVLEGETKDAIARQMDLFQTRALPDLHRNIKWGNSLVDVDAYDILSPDTFEDESNVLDICPFHWKTEFPFLGSGAHFDVVVGNPPYLPIFEMRKDLLPYYQASYSTFQKRFDAYGLFLEAILSRLTGPKSRLGLIIPSSLLNNQAFSRTRELLASRLCVEEIVVLGGSVFKNVNKDTLTLTASGSGENQIVLRQHLATPAGFGPEKAPPVHVPQSAISASGISLRSKAEDGIISKLESKVCRPLSEIARTFQGIVTGADDVFIAESFDLDASDRGLLKPFLFGSDISEFRPPSGRHKLLYMTKDIALAGRPKVLAQLRPAKTRLERRRETAAGKIPWHALHWPRKPSIFEQPKILVQGIRNVQLRRRLIATVDLQNAYAGVNLNIVNLHPGSPVSLYALVGILNSRVINFWFTHKFVDHRIKNVQLEEIPIPVLSASLPSLCAKIDSKVQELIAALEKAGATGSGAAGVWASKAAAARERVEELVEELYGLDQHTRSVIRKASCNM